MNVVATSFTTFRMCFVDFYTEGLASQATNRNRVIVIVFGFVILMFYFEVFALMCHVFHFLHKVHQIKRQNEHKTRDIMPQII